MSRTPAPRRIPYAAAALLILAALACKATEPSAEIPFAPNQVTDAAALQALACGATHHLTVQRPYQSLRLFLVPGYPIEVAGQHVAAYSRGAKVWVAAPLAGESRVWAHELLHEMYGLPGLTRAEHPPIFADCGLLDL